VLKKLDTRKKTGPSFALRAHSTLIETQAKLSSSFAQPRLFVVFDDATASPDVSLDSLFAPE